MSQYYPGTAIAMTRRRIGHTRFSRMTQTVKSRDAGVGLASCGPYHRLGGKGRRRGWERCLHLLRERKHHLYLFDELVYVLKYEFLSLDEVLAGLKERDPNAHVILTGRDAPVSLIEMADFRFAGRD